VEEEVEEDVEEEVDCLISTNRTICDCSACRSSLNTLMAPCSRGLHTSTFQLKIRRSGHTSSFPPVY